jgi:dihydrofolate reductase
VTRRAGLELPGATVVGSLDEALSTAGDVPEVCIIGGAEIYRLALPLADTLHVTRVHAVVDADTYFPVLDLQQWEEVAREERAADERHAHAYSFVELRRRA